MEQIKANTTRSCRCGQREYSDTMPMYIPDTLMLALLLACSWCTIALAINTPGSTTWSLVWRNGALGQGSAAVFLGATALLLLDVIANDAMPRRYRLKWLRRVRWVSTTSIAAVYFLFAAIATLPDKNPQGSWVLIAYYSIVGCITLWLVMYAKVKRYKIQMAVKNAIPEPT
jgi:hypothetical protein